MKTKILILLSIILIGCKKEKIEVIEPLLYQTNIIDTLVNGNDTLIMYISIMDDVTSIGDVIRRDGELKIDINGDNDYRAKNIQNGKLRYLLKEVGYIYTENEYNRLFIDGLLYKSIKG